MTLLQDAPVSTDTQTMRAAVIAAPRRLEIVQVPLPTPGPNQVRVRLQGCGVCASNIPPWEGRPWFSYPMPPGSLGHEGWGIIDALGDGVTKFTVGDRIAFLSDRAYAECELVPFNKALLLPASLATTPFPGEPLGCAMNIFRRCEIKQGQNVAIIGIGFLGALLVQLAKDAGARVIAISRRRWAVDLAGTLGADESIQLDEQWKVVRRVAELTGGSGGYDVKGFCDCVIECAGKQEAIDLAGELCGVRGRLVIAGYHQDGLRQVNMQLWNWRGLDVINAHEREESVYLRGISDAIEAVKTGRLDPCMLYTHTFALEQLGEALDMAQARPDGFVKALISF